jgi:hypothetical protein
MSGARRALHEALAPSVLARLRRDERQAADALPAGHHRSSGRFDLAPALGAAPEPSELDADSEHGRRPRARPSTATPDAPRLPRRPGCPS